MKTLCALWLVLMFLALAVAAADRSYRKKCAGESWLLELNVAAINLLIAMAVFGIWILMLVTGGAS